MAYKARFLAVSNRCFHDSAIRTEKMTQGTRLAGRLRFYKQVGVKQVTAPWEKQEEKSIVDSPISAGVDGSDSASGVQHLSKDLGASQLEYLLSPRRPGSTTVSDGPNEWYGITLDGRTMKTPMGQIMAVPSQSLAYAIAAEWDAQTKYLQPANMPLMTLACTALDQVVHNPEAYRKESLNYLTTDTVSLLYGDIINFEFPSCVNTVHYE
jgi:ATP synthase F1 complex assembly factor 2